MNYDKELYRILQIEPGADQEMINAAYNALVEKYHPDVYEDKEEANLKMIEIKAAYEVLSFPKNVQNTTPILNENIASKQPSLLLSILQSNKKSQR